MRAGHRSASLGHNADAIRHYQRACEIADASKGVSPGSQTEPDLFEDVRVADWQDRYTLEFTDNLTWIKGRHVVKWGLKMRHYQWLGTDSKNYMGNWTFNGQNTENPASPTGSGDAETSRVRYSENILRAITGSSVFPGASRTRSDPREEAGGAARVKALRTPRDRLRSPAMRKEAHPGRRPAVGAPARSLSAAVERRTACEAAHPARPREPHGDPIRAKRSVERSG